MWILPRQLHTSPYVPDTAALISDLNEQSQACAQSLLVRSKPSPARTWSLKWKRDSWTQLLSGRILKPSHGPSFTAAWTSSVAATRASHSALPASDSAPKTHDTSGHTYQPELLQCDQVAASLKTSRDISRWGCPTSSKTWADWVTERRGAWRQRVNAARLTSGRGSSFWPSVVASEVRQGFQDRSRGMKGSQESLTTAVVKDAANWPTPCGNDDNKTPEAHLAMKKRMGERDGTNSNRTAITSLQVMCKALHGPAAPANGSTNGSRQGLWATPRSADARNPGLTNCKPGSMLHLGTQAARQELWLTPRANEPDSDPNFAARNADRGAHCHGTLSSQAKGELYPTPRTCDWKSSPNASQNQKRMEVGQATLAEFVHAKHKKGDLWSTPRTGATESSRPNNKGGIPLADQAKREEWGTPTARDHKSGRGNEDRQYKELTPMVERQQSGKLNPRWVETLMGLPIGWTMPSCTSPQTIAPMSCDSSATESCQPPQSELLESSLEN
jgi:hypothetical protein